MTNQFKFGIRNSEFGMELRLERSLPFLKAGPSSFRIPHSTFRIRSGFTLIEIVIVLTLLIIIVGATVPTVRGLKEEQMARVPVAELVKMAKETRLQAMKDRRPYQIAFTSKGFSATRYLSPYLQAAQLEEFLQKVQNDESKREEIDDGSDQLQAPQTSLAQQQQQQNGQPPPKEPAYKEWTKKYELPSDSHVSIQFWYDGQPTQIDGDTVKLWVFQPSGIVTPLTVRLDREKAHFEASFNALTADVVKESSDLK